MSELEDAIAAAGRAAEVLLTTTEPGVECEVLRYLGVAIVELGVAVGERHPAYDLLAAQGHYLRIYAEQVAELFT